MNTLILHRILIHRETAARFQSGQPSCLLAAAILRLGLIDEARRGKNNSPVSPRGVQGL